MRVLGKLGLAFFVVALVVIYAQTFPSMTSQSEILVRLLLWLWVVINLAIVVTLLVNAGFQQAFPGYQFQSEDGILAPPGGGASRSSGRPFSADVQRNCRTVRPASVSVSAGDPLQPRDSR
ncbi:multidrug efflux system protein MdtO [Raoultella planticola]|uniref:Multidrug efflux system protein MdtO n=1 Tax=Raoultella planticola TaxID=575 RepID=A0A485BS77_RAOPL|nr:multidrug efflux system protein MdtO [Raoultella planticola]